MSELTFSATHGCDALIRAQPTRRVRFAVRLTEVWEISHQYPQDFFYSQVDTPRFLAEAKAESAVQSPASTAHDVLDIASSSIVLMVLFLLLSLTATLACIPFLVVMKIASVMKFGFFDDDSVDSSIRTDLQYSRSELIPDRVFLELFNTVEGIFLTKRAG
ncbi:hypothetical protein ACHAXS_006373 [Conticribra weissflogii]